MRKLIYLLFVLIIFSLHLHSQKKSDFNIKAPDIKIENSKYATLHYIESRPDPENLGMSYVNKWNGVQAVTLNQPVEDQLQLLFPQLISSVTHDAGTLALQMRVLFFEPFTSETKGKGLARLRMTLYKKENEKYLFLNTIDTLIVDGNMDARPAAGEVITAFIADNLQYEPYEDEEVFNISQVMDIDVYEKNSIPFFLQSDIPDGIYYKYNSLKNLTPDDTSEIRITKGDEEKIKEVKIPDPEKPGKEKKLKQKEIYAFVYKGVPYIGYEGDFYPASFNDGFWSFKISYKTSGGFSIGIGVGASGRSFGGGGGVRIPIGGKKETAEIFIDHLNGEFF